MSLLKLVFPKVCAAESQQLQLQGRVAPTRGTPSSRVPLCLSKRARQRAPPPAQLQALLVLVRSTAVVNSGYLKVAAAAAAVVRCAVGVSFLLSGGTPAILAVAVVQRDGLQLAAGHGRRRPLTPLPAGGWHPCNS
jgi:hypothetical protein